MGNSAMQNMLLHPENEGKIKTLFSKYDKNHDGTISKAEYEGFCHELNESIKTMNYWPSEKNKEQVMLLQTFLSHWDEVDLNGDGEISLEELTKTVRSCSRH
jgi:Ca2+-binding EF-hand superfamily protein